MSTEGQLSRRGSREALEFAPGLLAIQESPPAPLPRTVLYLVVLLFCLLLGWATFGTLDIIATANGKLVPRTYVKIVQPADSGIIKTIFVHEGQHVSAGDVLLSMDSRSVEADAQELATAIALRSLQLRRIDAELQGIPLRRLPSDPRDLFDKVTAQYVAHRQAFSGNLAQARDALNQARQDYASGAAVLQKLSELDPILASETGTYRTLAQQGYVPRLALNDKEEASLENTNDLLAQKSRLIALSAAIDQSQEKVNETVAQYRSDLQNERVSALLELGKLQQESSKVAREEEFLELKAPESGIVNDLAVHTPGTVVAAGTVLLSLVPENEPLVAEVMVRNEDVGFVAAGQEARVKLAAYPFQKYGLLRGKVIELSPDTAASDQGNDDRPGTSSDNSRSKPDGAYRALVQLRSQSLENGSSELKALSGMQVVAEINEGHRTVLEYLLSPVQRMLQEGGHER